MNPDTVDKVLEWLKNVATFAATNIWRITMRQVYTYGILDIIVGVIFLIIGVFLLIFGKKVYDKDGDLDNGSGFMFCFGALAMFIFIVLSLFSLRWFINPEWYAITLILEQIH